MNFNVATHITRRAVIDPAKVAVIFEDRSWSYKELDDAVSETAALLADAGIDRTDRVAILGRNSDEYVIACLAIARIGAVSVLLNFLLGADELCHLITDSEPVALLIDEDFLEIQSTLEKAITDLRLSLLLYAESEAAESICNRRASFKGQFVENVPMGEDDLDRILYTSGTTSRPKGVMLSHGNASWNLLTQILEGCCSPDERNLVFAPLYHIGAQELPGMRVFAVGATMVIMRKFDARGVLQQVSKHSITGMAMVSTMVHIMRDLPDRLEFDTNSLRWLAFGQVPENMLEDIRSIFPNAALKNSYGLTECGSTATVIDDRNQREKPLSTGLVVPTLEMKIVDDDGNAVNRGQLGEIVLKGPKVMLGYWRQPEATAEALRNGWLHTGDIGKQDEEGFLYVVDRKKDMIRTGGENVSSQEVERVIYEMGNVSEVAVIPLADEKWGEVVKAVIVARDGIAIRSEDVISFCRTQLASFKVPKVVEFRTELPRNPSGKILKRNLR